MVVSSKFLLLGLPKPEDLHNYFSDLIDFEEAIKQYGKDFHGKHGFPGSMGDMPKKGQKAGEVPEDPIKKILKSQTEAAARATQTPQMMKTGDGGQVVFDPATETGHVKTPAAVPRAEPTPEADPSPEAAPATDAEEAPVPVEEPVASTTPEVEPVAVEAEASAEEETAAAKPAPTAAEEAEQSPEGHVKDEL